VRATQKKTQARHVSPVCGISGGQSRHLILQVRVKDTAFSFVRQGIFGGPHYTYLINNASSKTVTEFTSTQKYDHLN